jgi:hypothetical protein
MPDAPRFGVLNPLLRDLGFSVVSSKVPTPDQGEGDQRLSIFIFISISKKLVIPGERAARG